MPAQDFLYRAGAAELIGHARTRFEQDLDRCGVIAGFPIPSVLRPVDRPVQGCDSVIIVGILDRRVISQNPANQFSISVPSCPMQWCSVVLSETLHWQACGQHQTGGYRVIGPGCVIELSSARG